MHQTIIALLALATTLCHAVVITPQGSRPWLLSGPADKEDILARLAVFPYPTSAILDAYLHGSAAQQLAETNNFFTALPNPFISGRRTAEYLNNYDIVLAMGFATEAQQQMMRDRTAAYARTALARFPAILPPTEYTNGALDEFIVLGLAAINFPDHPDAQTWINRAVDLTQQLLDVYYSPDGAALESPNYHQWELSQLARFLSALRRCTDVDLLNHPGLRNALEWLIRFSSPPHNGTASYTIPSWGDTWYGTYYTDLPVYAAAFRTSDPDFSQRLMHWWRITGSPVNSGWDFPTVYPQLLDPRLADAPLAPFASTYSPYRGQATLRAETGGPDEFFATFTCGQRGVSHHHADHSQIELFAFGVPLALDSMSGPYDTTDPASTMKSWNRQTMAHNVVRCVVPEPASLRDTSGQFQAFGSSAIADYVVGQSPNGPTAIRHLVMMKGDYLVVWDQITAATYSEWFFHTPAQTLEWQAHKVISHTAWNVDLDIHFLLPAAPLPAPTVASSNISVDYTTRNALASEAPVPTSAKLYTGQGDGRLGNWTDPSDAVPGNDNWNLKWLKYLFVRSPSADGDYLTVMQPRQVGVTPALTTTLVSSSATGVSLTVNYNGRLDTITIDTTGATITQGGQPGVQFAKTLPQSGVSGAARYVLSNNTTTTLSTALTTTGAVDIVTGTLALGNHDCIPDTAPVIIRPGGTLDLRNRNDTVAKLTMDCGTLIGSGTLTVGAIDWYGGSVAANIHCTGPFTKKGGAAWSPSPVITYSGDTVIETGTLALQPGAATLPGTNRAVLGNGTTLAVNGTQAAIASLEISGAASMAAGSGSLTVNSTLAGNGSLTVSGNLDLASAAIASTLSLGIDGTVTLPPGTTPLNYLSINGVVQPAGIVVNAATHPGFIAGSGSITPQAGIGIPGSLTATAAPGSVALAWSALAGATGYSVRRAMTAGGPYSEVGIAVSNGFADTTVTNGVTYYYVIAGRIAVGDGIASVEVSATPSLPVWTGSTSTAWETVGNWLTAIPNSSCVARFSGPLTTNQPTVSGACSVAGLLFESPGWILNSASAGTLTIGAEGVVNNATSGTTTLNKAVTVLAGNHFWQGKTGSTLVVASLAGPTATSTLQWGDATDPAYQGTLKLTYNGNGPNIYFVVASGTLQAHKSGWINNRDLTVSGGTFLVTSSNGDLIRSDYGVTLNSGLIQWGGFNEAFKVLALNGGTMRGSGSTVSLTDLSGAIARISGNVTLGHVDDANLLKLTRAGTNGSLDLGTATRTVTISSPVEFALPITNTDGGLAKTGAGTLTLSAANTYNGGTDVDAGTLVADTAGTLGSGNLTVGAAAICDLRNAAGAVADTASVYLTGGGGLMLAAGVSESVAKLYIDGVLAKTGTWNANRDPGHFSGAGQLIVTDGVPLTTAEIWRQQNFGSIDNAGDSADGADPDQDGTINLIERALGMNPNGADTGYLPAIDATQAGFAFMFTKSRSATDLTLVVQESPDMTPDSWTTASGATELIDDSNAGFQRFRFTPTPGPATRKFYHLWIHP